MSQFVSSEIVTNGLVFAYDMNSRRSYFGEPTTNHVGNASSMTGWSTYDNGNDGTFITEFGTTGYRMNARGSWNGVYKGIAVPSTGTYTLSAYIRYWGGAANNNGATVYCSGYGGGDVATAINKSIVGEWQRISLTVNATNLSFTFFLISYGGTNGGDNVTWEVTMPQVNAGSYATTFTNTSRSNTQAIVDLTGNYTIDATNLSYESTGDFFFDNTNDFLDVTPFTATTISNATIEAWVYDSSADTNYRAIVQNNVASDDALYVNPSNQLMWWPSTASSLTVPKNAWTYVAASHTYGTGILYQVNSSQQTVAGTFEDPTDWDFMRIGGHSGSDTERWGGKITVVRVYNRALSSNELQQNFNAQRGRYGI